MPLGGEQRDASQLYEAQPVSSWPADKTCSGLARRSIQRQRLLLAEDPLGKSFHRGGDKFWPLGRKPVRRSCRLSLSHLSEQFESLKRMYSPVPMLGRCPPSEGQNPPPK